MTEGLDGGLEFVVTVEVGGEAGWVELFLEEGLEAVDDQSAFEASVGSKDVGFGLAELKGPLSDDNDLCLKFLNGNGRELLLEFSEGGVGEVRGDIEV